MKKIIAIALIMSFLFSQPLFAAPAIADVDSGHWAYDSIRNIVNAGHMSANASDEFRPNAPIDKFETSRILASMAGATPTLLDLAYENHSATIAVRSAQYTRWNDSSNREVAFLLERGIFIESDLGNFIVRTGDVENLRALSRQEVAVYLVRLMERGSAARAANLPQDFADNSRINSASRPYVYYLRSLGIIAGEPNNNFNPNGIVTRTTLAVLLDRVSQAVNLPAPPPQQQPEQQPVQPAQPAPPPTPTPVNVSAISGNIEQVNVSTNSLQIRQMDGDVRIIALGDGANIFVNGERQTISNLLPSMSLIGVITGGFISDLHAHSVVAAPAPPPAVSALLEERQIIGTVREVGQGSISVDVRILNPQGFVVTQRETITITQESTLVRSATPITISNISPNDAINAVVRGNTAVRIDLFERSRSMNVTVVERRTESVLGTNYFIAQDRNGMLHELVINDATMLRRIGSIGEVQFRDIRIGDSLDLIAEYSLIIEAYAYGSRGNAEGTISEILIGQTGTSVVLVDSRGQTQRYHVRENAFDIHTMRVGQRVNLRLDSLEIESFTTF